MKREISCFLGLLFLSFLTAFLTVFIIGCPLQKQPGNNAPNNNNGNNGDGTAPQAKVYVSGYYTGASNDVAVYWIDDSSSAVILYDQGSARVYDLQIVGGIVYTAGYFNNGGNDTACYWKNTTKVDLSGGVSSKAFGIDVYNGSVYVAGYYNDGTNDIACYWKNNSAGVVDLYNSPTNNAESHSIYVDGSDIYVSGFYNVGTTDTACYWKNGIKTDLYSVGNSDAYSITVSYQ